MSRAAEEFLGVAMPARFHDAVQADGRSPAELELHDTVAIYSRLLERPPFFLVSKAVSMGRSDLWAVAPISLERCAGHFPQRPIVPLIRMCEAAAQAGVFLIGLNGTAEHAPIAVGSGNSKATTKHFVEPPVTLLIHARKVRERMGSLFVVDAAWHCSGSMTTHVPRPLHDLNPRFRASPFVSKLPPSDEKDSLWHRR